MPDSLYETLHETKSHYNTDFSYNTYPCTIPQDFAVVPLHWHNEMELIYIKEGKGLVNIDLNQHLVGQGDLLIVYPGRIHSITNYDNYVLKYENIILICFFLKNMTEILLNISDILTTLIMI